MRSLFTRHRHDASGSIDSALESSERGVRALWVSLLGLTATAVVQLVVALASGSVALLSDTFHNFADAFTALPLWLAFSLGRRLPSARYPFGYGRAEDLAGGAVVAMIAVSAVIAAWEAIDRLLHPSSVHYLGAVVAASLVGFAGNELVARHRIRVGREIGSAALVADGLHARTDGISSLGVLAGAIGVAAGFDRADAIAGLAIAVLIVSVLREAAGDVVARLMDAVDPALAEQARGVLAGVDGVVGVGELRVRWIGHRLHAEAEVVVDGDLSLAAAHRITEDARHRLLHDIPRLVTAIIHADPCGHDGVDPHADLQHHDPRARDAPRKPDPDDGHGH
ncbi:MAG TPA: cation diffusion facilitator family transporter [Acidimicrobiia bacterium]|nr:cation diffusion facilitator family transporter [Acidimicrobiia bacterium]